MKWLTALAIVSMCTSCPKEEPQKPRSVEKTAPVATGIPVWKPPTGTPKSLPLLEVKGLDAFGYPNQIPDKAALLALLRGRQFDPLTQFLDQIADQVKADFHKELWMFVALNSFYQAAPDLQDALDWWVKAHPESFAPWAARSHYLFAVAKVTRGGAPASETPKARMAAMETFNERASADLAKAAELRPDVVENIRWRTKMAMTGGGGDARAILADGVKVCRDCLTLYQGVMGMLRPNWGGSYEAMDALAAEAMKASSNPAMKLLAGASHIQRCDEELNHERFDQALVECDKALQSGRWYDYLVTRADIDGKNKQPQAALPYLDEALAQWPQHAEALAKRAGILRGMGRWEEARNDILLALYVEPNHDHVKWERWQTMRAILKVAEGKFKAKTGRPLRTSMIRRCWSSQTTRNPGSGAA
jgi:tetratricopeptide (TPR) repeat protein